MPGDKYKFDVEYLTRTQPVETSAYTRFREYFDFYAVPLRLLWKSAPSVLTQMQDINQIQALSLTQNLSLGTYLPAFTLNTLSSVLYSLAGNQTSPGTSKALKNAFGYYRADLSYKLLSYLGYGNLMLSILPVLSPLKRLLIPVCVNILIFMLCRCVFSGNLLLLFWHKCRILTRFKHCLWLRICLLAPICLLCLLVFFHLLWFI